MLKSNEEEWKSLTVEKNHIFLGLNNEIKLDISKVIKNFCKQSNFKNFIIFMNNLFFIYYIFDQILLFTFKMRILFGH